MFCFVLFCLQGAYILLRRNKIGKWRYNMELGCHECFEERLKFLPLRPENPPNHLTYFQNKKKKEREREKGLPSKQSEAESTQWQPLGRTSNPGLITISVSWVKLIYELNVWVESLEWLLSPWKSFYNLKRVLLYQTSLG